MRKSANKLLIALYKQAESIEKFLGIAIEQKVGEENIKCFLQSYSADEYKLWSHELLKQFEKNNVFFQEKMQEITTELQGDIYNLEA